MSWWAWILFWCVFWTCAFAYLAWRTWRLWPHAREFGRTCSSAFERIEQARDLASRSAAPAAARTAGSTTQAPSDAPGAGTTLVTSDRTGTSDDLAWNTPASEWRARRAAARRRRRDVRLDDHTAVWSGWRDPLD